LRPLEVSTSKILSCVSILAKKLESDYYYYYYYYYYSYSYYYYYYLLLNRTEERMEVQWKNRQESPGERVQFDSMWFLQKSVIRTTTETNDMLFLARAPK